MKTKRETPRVVSVYPARPVQPGRTTTSIEDEAPPSMATPAAEVHVLPPVILIRPSWLDLPARRLVSRLTLIAVCAIPGAIALTVTIHIAWRLS